MARKHRKQGIIKSPVTTTSIPVERKVVLDPKTNEYVVVTSITKQGKALRSTTERGKRNGEAAKGTFTKVPLKGARR